MIARRKMRYLMVEASRSLAINDPRNTDMLKGQLLSFMGELPYFKANPQVASQLSGRVFIMSVNRGSERGVVLALAFIKNIGGTKVGFYTIRTSGTIRSLNDAFGELYGACANR